MDKTSVFESISSDSKLYKRLLYTEAIFLTGNKPTETQLNLIEDGVKGHLDNLGLPSEYEQVQVWTHLCMVEFWLKLDPETRIDYFQAALFRLGAHVADESPSGGIIGGHNVE